MFRVGNLALSTRFIASDTHRNLVLRFLGMTEYDLSWREREMNFPNYSPQKLIALAALFQPTQVKVNEHCIERKKSLGYDLGKENFAFVFQ